MTSIAAHAQRNTIRIQLRQNHVLKQLDTKYWDELEPKLEIIDYAKGSMLVTQGSEEMEQFFILEGILKRVVGNSEGKEMILRLAAETDMDTSYAAWRLGTPTPYSIVALTNARVAKIPMEAWVEFLQTHPEMKNAFEYEIMQLMSEVMAPSSTQAPPSSTQSAPPSVPSDPSVPSVPSAPSAPPEVSSSDLPQATRPEAMRREGTSAKRETRMEIPDSSGNGGGSAFRGATFTGASWQLCVKEGAGERRASVRPLRAPHESC